MRTEHLPELNTKKEKNVVQITNAKLTGVPAGAFDNGVAVEDSKSGEGSTISIPAELFEYKQFDSLSEFVADCGGDSQALEMVNDFKRSASLDEAKVGIRTTTNSDINVVVAAALKSCLDHTFSGANKISGREAKELITDLRAKASTLSDAELAAEMRKILGA